jgi:hypothetical protein
LIEQMRKWPKFLLPLVLKKTNQRATLPKANHVDPNGRGQSRGEGALAGFRR